MIFLYSFLTCGGICMLGQLIFDFTKLSAGHITSFFVVVGAILGSFGIYDKLTAFAGAGASLPITSFGNLLVSGAIEGIKDHGLLGATIDLFEMTSAGITSAIFFAFIMAIIFKPRS